MNNLARAFEAGLRHAESIELYEKTVPESASEARRPSSDGPDLDVRAGERLSGRGPTFAGDRPVRIDAGEGPGKLGEQHPDTLNSLFELASAYASGRQPNKAVASRVSFSIEPSRPSILTREGACKDSARRNSETCWWNTHVVSP